MGSRRFIRLFGCAVLLAFLWSGAASASDLGSQTPSLGLQSVYHGLFSEENQSHSYSSGSFTLSVTAAGAYSGSLQFGGRRSSFTGHFDSQSQTANVLSPGNENPLQLQLQIGSGSQAGLIFGTLSGGSWSAKLSGNRAVFDARANPSPFAGTYTIVFPAFPGDPSLPAGESFGTVQVTSAGNVRLLAKLADGSTASQSATVSAQGNWPLYVSLASGQEVLLGWLAFDAFPTANPGGGFYWMKSANARARYFPAGFACTGQALGSPYLPARNAAEAVPNLSQARVGFSGGDLSESLGVLVEAPPANGRADAEKTPLALNVSPATGIFAGTVFNPATGKRLAFGGVVLQNLDVGFGLLLGTDQSSLVVLRP